MVEVIEPEVPVDIAALDAKFDAAFAARELPGLVGSYQNTGKVILQVAADGKVTLGNRPMRALLRRCTPEPPLPEHAPCLVWQQGSEEPKPGDPVFLLVRGPQGLVFHEGTLGSDVAYYPFESKPGAEPFVRVNDK